MSRSNASIEYSYLSLVDAVLYFIERLNTQTVYVIGDCSKTMLMKLARASKIVVVNGSSFEGLENVEFIVHNLDDLSIPIESADESLIVSFEYYDTLAGSKGFLDFIKRASGVVPFVFVASSGAKVVRDRRSLKLFALTMQEAYDKAGIAYIEGRTSSESIIKDTTLLISGSHSIPTTKDELVSKKILAIMTCYNEEDIVEQSVGHLLQQGVDVHVIDNWSTDSSWDKLQKLSVADQRVTCERFPAKKPETHVYEWTKLLKRAEVISSGRKYDWYIHNDIDELRFSPWVGVSLQEAITYIDSLGYNAADLTVADFRPTEDGFNNLEDPLKFFSHFELADKGGYFLQIKLWKYVDRMVDLSSTGGHHAQFEGQKIFPMKFMTRHFPLRSVSQANKKIFKERKKDFDPAERKKGWHIQYDSYNTEITTIWDVCELFSYDSNTHKELLIELITGVGIDRLPQVKQRR